MEDEQLAKLVQALYDESVPRRRYKIRYSALGATAPFVLMTPADSVITLNEDHVLVQEHSEKDDGRRALELFAIAEVMLETYMREADISKETIRELLSRRDLLLQSLALDEVHSLKAIARALRDNATESTDSKALEIAVVGALRAVGFAASHVSGSKAPDGVAGYQVYGVESTRIIIETKASTDNPSLGHLDLAGIHSHAVAVNASGAILVSPGYPGAEDENSEISLRAVQQRVSCWTVEQLARVVERAERRHINAADVQGIVLNQFRPLDVAHHVTTLLETPSFDRRSLYRAILDALDMLSERLTDIPRNLSLIAGRIIDDPELQTVNFKDISEAALDLAHVSRGLLHVTDEGNDVIVFGDLAELRRRAAPLTELAEPPRRRGAFRDRTSTPADGRQE